MKKMSLITILFGIFLFCSASAEMKHRPIKDDAAMSLAALLEKAGVIAQSSPEGVLSFQIHDLLCVSELARRGRFSDYSHCSFLSIDDSGSHSHQLRDQEADQLKEILVSSGVPFVHTLGVDELRLNELKCSSLGASENLPDSHRYQCQSTL